MKCEHTKDGHGFYAKFVQSYKQYYTPDGNPSITDDGVESGFGRGGTVAYCENCNARLGRLRYDINRHKFWIDTEN